MTYEYDELFGWAVYDENGCPISRHFETEGEVKQFIKEVKNEMDK